MKYTRAFEISECVLRDRAGREQYRPDVLRTAALAAAETSSFEDALSAIERAFLGARVSVNPAWDGSIA